ncbi:phosphoribosylamine--glycine ligase [Phocicoccus pinnipedialis]|uniref:Phosphoribosylamine--glycine ligase n=1 Tax=Phocicoccus pinnipedialis TaxID=110845 RepID=A0A6V7RJ45_9BACL|nr:phosphoribosylamine--glycine ligase [Jeotgalicoccus pinnipedialis]MBP1938979.1 phosphoribosylamine--glycine ligase [Jeotgalicoccus pinnipedialis]CAD2077316.1 Phosphoribosylamine--glycine ligase [Jeotgalicoccus pinnipedialis]
MNVAVIGSGGREHAIVKMLSESKNVDEIYAIPGNAGMNDLCEVMYRVKEDDFHAIAGICIERQVDWVIIGPPEPLEKGLADYLIDEYGLTVFGPRKKEAQMETSKVFTKELLNKYNIPTADFEVFRSFSEAKEYLKDACFPKVIKQDGLGSVTGVGVRVVKSAAEAMEALNDIAIVTQDDSIEPLIIEEHLDGEEFSLMVLVNGDAYHAFETIAQDHKSAYAKGVGPNTNGMGAYAPVTHITEDIRQEAITKLIEPTINAMVDEGLDYFGVLYLGAMNTSDGVKVIEYNSRFGDPEAQVLMGLLENDFLEMLNKLKNKEPFEMKWKDGFIAGVVLATKDYPFEVNKGLPLYIPEELMDDIFISGVSQTEDGDYVSADGRVLMVTGYASTLEEAVKKAYDNMDQLAYNPENFYYRKDIAHRALGTLV